MSQESEMSFDPETATIRFGSGLSPRVVPPAGMAQMLTPAKAAEKTAAAKA